MEKRSGHGRSGDSRPATTTGAELAGQLAQHGDEIRTATVLFADVVDFTRLSATMELESIKRLMDLLFDRLYRIVLGHGGVVDKYIGDCIMALFGAPIAYGDDAARAVRAALEIQQGTHELRPELRAAGLPPIRLRVGVNTGTVIAGAVGAGPQRRYTVMGHTVNLASHLQQEAPIGGVVIGEGCYRRVRGLFEASPYEAESGQAYLVEGEAPGGLWLRPREVLGSELELVGRDGELAQLHRHFARTCADNSARMVVLVGEPGIGKSRLAFELISQLAGHRPPVTSVVGFAHPLSRGVPFGPVAEALRRTLGLAVDDSPQSIEHKLRAVIDDPAAGSRPADEVERDMATARQLLGLPSPEEQASDARTSDSPQLFAQRSMDLVARLLQLLLADGPLVVVLEELHWCDASTLRLLEYVLRRLASRPLLILGVARPEFAQENARMLRTAAVHRIEVGPLPDESIRQLLADALSSEPSEQLVQLVVDRSRGNPYHVEELLRTLEERGVLTRLMSGWELQTVPIDLGVPPGVESLVQARIDNLSSAQRELLRVAAAVGRTFWDGLLGELCPHASALEMSMLVRRELIAPSANSRFVGSREYHFLHELTRDVAYGMIPHSERADLHSRIAAWLLEQATDAPEGLALAARHLDLGGETRRAAICLRQAGDAAYATASYAAAALHYTRALELTRGDPRQQLELYSRRERVLNALGRWAEQRDDAQRMLELARQAAEPNREVDALFRVGRANLNVGEHATARRAFAEAQAIAEREGDREGQARGLRWQAMVHFNRSEHLQALPLFERALGLADEATCEALAAELAYEMGVTVGTIGDYTRALDVSLRALKMFREQGNRYQEAFCLANLGCFHTYLGEHEEAVVALEQAVALGAELGAPLAEASAQANLGNAYRFCGQLERALELEQRAAAVAADIGDPRLAADAFVYEALAARDAGQLDRARQRAAEALALAKRSQVPASEAMAETVLAGLDLAAGAVDEGLAHSRRAVAVLDEVGSVEGFEQQIRLVHADLCAAAGHHAEAREVLARARAELERKAGWIHSEQRRSRYLRAPTNADIVQRAGQLDTEPTPGIGRQASS